MLRGVVHTLRVEATVSMPETGSSGNGADDRGAGPIDLDVLDRIETHLAGSERFSGVEFQPAHAPNSVVAEYDLGYFPPSVTRAYLDLRWYVTDDFNIHYSEQYDDGDQWECRWDRHPNEHNTREHFHPPPTAEKPGEDAEFPWEWQDVLTLVLEELDARVQSFWA